MYTLSNNSCQALIRIDGNLHLSSIIQIYHHSSKAMLQILLSHFVMPKKILLQTIPYPTRDSSSAQDHTGGIMFLIIPVIHRAAVG